MGLIQKIIDQGGLPGADKRVMDRSIKKEKRKKLRKDFKKKISRGRDALEKGGEKIVRAGERIGKARIKFRKGSIPKGFKPR